MDPKQFERRLGQIEKRVSNGSKKTTEDWPPAGLSSVELYAINQEILEDAKLHPGKYGEDELKRWRESLALAEQLLGEGDAICDDDDTGQLAERRREYESRFRAEVAAVREVTLHT